MSANVLAHHASLLAFAAQQTARKVFVSVALLAREVLQLAWVVNAGALLVVDFAVLVFALDAELELLLALHNLLDLHLSELQELLELIVLLLDLFQPIIVRFVAINQVQQGALLRWRQVLLALYGEFPAPTVR